MHSRKFRNGTKKWRKRHRKFNPNSLIFWKPSRMKWSDIEFCKYLADKIDVVTNSGYIITAKELESVVVIDQKEEPKII